MARKPYKPKNNPPKVSTKKIKISACYIVKNNAAELELSLQSLKNFVDEIIVVDTGSTDETVQVAEKFGAKIFYEAWQNDFSTPRNVALKNASGDWIIFLDSDEYFSAETAQNIRLAVERAQEFHKQGMLVFLVNIDVDDGNKILGTNFVLRIFKNLRDMHYVGKIHEELRIGKYSLSKITFAPPNILTLYHTGYSKNLNKGKAERNLKLLLEELKETSEPQRIYGYIAESYFGLDDLTNAEKFARLDIEQKKVYAPRSYRIILEILANAPERLNERKFFAEKALETMQLALTKFKNYKDIHPSTFSAENAAFAEGRIKIWQKK
jgi:glycosyltransferase involved in cell wall biosynthesis